MDRIHLLILSGFLGVAISTNAQRSITMPGTTRIESLMTEYHVPVVGVSIIEDGKMTQAAVFGTLPNKRPRRKIRCSILLL
jgi:hypothetical protein